MCGQCDSVYPPLHNLGISQQIPGCCSRRRLACESNQYTCRMPVHRHMPKKFALICQLLYPLLQRKALSLLPLTSLSSVHSVPLSVQWEGEVERAGRLVDNATVNVTGHCHASFSDSRGRAGFGSDYEAFLNLLSPVLGLGPK